jgi:hypothetical protein
MCHFSPAGAVVAHALVAASCASKKCVWRIDLSQRLKDERRSDYITISLPRRRGVGLELAEHKKSGLQGLQVWRAP